MIKLDYSCNVLSSLVGEQVDGEFEALFFGMVLEGDILIEDIAVVLAGGIFAG